jgi:3-phytase
MPGFSAFFLPRSEYRVTKSTFDPSALVASVMPPFRIRGFLRFAAVFFLLSLAACQSPASRQVALSDPPPLAASQAGLDFAQVAERFVSASMAQDMVDSVASWDAPDGTRWALVTGKQSDQLLVFDGSSGELLTRFGSGGSGPGQFDYPNGIFVIEDLVWIVERDNRRVQLLRLPDFEPLGSFGESELRAPFGLWLHKDGEAFELYVSDGFMLPPNYQTVPPLAELAQRFKRYRVALADGELHVHLVGPFGATDPAGAIRIAESLWGDPAFDRLLIAEEHRPTGTVLRLYDLQGQYRGRDVGAGEYRAEAEGIALWHCPDGAGYWIGVDQFSDRTVFHLYDREQLEHRGSFAGEYTANTDGIWLEQTPNSAFPAGVLYAIHDDQALTAFDWRDIATALGLRANCE